MEFMSSQALTQLRHALQGRPGSVHQSYHEQRGGLKGSLIRAGSEATLKHRCTLSLGSK